jgi:hypothetical protein
MTYEGVRAKMTPKSDDEVMKSFDRYDEWMKLALAIENGVEWMVEEMLKNPKNEELLRYLNPGPVIQCLQRNDTEIIRMILKAGYKPFIGVEKYVESPEMMELLKKYIRRI